MVFVVIAIPTLPLSKLVARQPNGKPLNHTTAILNKSPTSRSDPDLNIMHLKGQFSAISDQFHDFKNPLFHDFVAKLSD